MISSEGGEQRRAGLVVFSAPPTGNPDYAQVGRPGAKYSRRSKSNHPEIIVLLLPFLFHPIQDVQSSISEHWVPGEGGVFVFTSAGSVYAENSGGAVDEAAATARTERSAKLLDAEEHVLAAGGTLLRLGGLYTETRGAAFRSIS